MKTFILTTASILVLAGGGLGYAAYASEDTTPTEKVDVIASEDTQTEEDTSTASEQQNQTDVEGKSDLQELDTLEEVVDTDNLDIEVVEDNKYKRIAVLTDANNQPQFKSIYIKKNNRLKVIDFKDGLVFNQVLDKVDYDVDTENQLDENGSSDQEVVEEDTELSNLEEYGTIANQVNVDDLDVQIVEDNPYKRILILNDEDGHTAFKSIYIKKKNILKVIDLHGGLVYNGTAK